MATGTVTVEEVIGVGALMAEEQPPHSRAMLGGETEKRQEGRRVGTRTESVAVAAAGGGEFAPS